MPNETLGEAGEQMNKFRLTLIDAEMGEEHAEFDTIEEAEKAMHKAQEIELELNDGVERKYIIELVS